jgi:hypothetical protein
LLDTEFVQPLLVGVMFVSIGFMDADLWVVGEGSAAFSRTLSLEFMRNDVSPASYCRRP